MRRSVKFLMPVALLLLVACGGRDADRAGSVIFTDSAGVTIVVSSTGDWTADSRWTLTPAPFLDIGGMNGSPDYELTRVRALWRMDDGTIVVANQGTSELRLYGADGTHLRSIGGRGAAPGEFQQLIWAAAGVGDSIVAFDLALSRLSYLSPQGDFVRSVQVVPPSGAFFVTPIGVLSDGAFVMRMLNPSSQSSPDGQRRSPERYLLYSSSGELISTISEQPGTESFSMTRSSGDGRTGITSIPLLFNRTQVESVNADRIVLSGGDDYELEVYAPDGALERLIRREVNPRPVTRAEIEAGVERALNSSTDSNRRATIQSALRTIEQPSTMPFFSSVLLDDTGCLWVQEFMPPSAAEAPPIWTVFDREGRMLGDLSLPADFTPTQIGEDFVLGIWRDDLNIEHVRIYGLTRDAR